MNAYLIESLAPLVFRAGKPFGSQASAQDATFPLPSTGAGLIRYLALSQGKVSDGYKDSDYEKLLKLQCYGVYLAQFDDDKNPTIFVPKPANSLCVEDDKGNMQLFRLAPKAFDNDCGSDLPNGLLYVRAINDKGEAVEVKNKPKNDIKYWQLDDVVKWQNGKNLTYTTISKNGLKSIPTEIRTHIRMNDEVQSVEDGQLFQTASFDMGYQKNSNGFDNSRLGFVVLSEQLLDDDLVTLGGERRLSYFKKLPQSFSLTHTHTAVQEINEAGGFCLTFLTPAIFAQGYLPSWIDKNTFTGIIPNTQVKVCLKVVAVERWQAVSGWDSVQWKPKATRKAVGAGSVYWFELMGDSKFDEQSLAYLRQSLSDNEFDKADGFGMAIVSAWQKV